MGNGRKLSFLEFLSDIRLVVTSPARRFALIKERGAGWGSLVLLMVPIYFGFYYMGGVYFDRDPFPGYSFIPPLVAAAVAVFLKLFFIHVVARMFRPQRIRRTRTGHLFRPFRRFRLYRRSRAADALAGIDRFPGRAAGDRVSHAELQGSYLQHHGVVRDRVLHLEFDTGCPGAPHRIPHPRLQDRDSFPPGIRPDGRARDRHFLDCSAGPHRSSVCATDRRSKNPALSCIGSDIDPVSQYQG